MGGMRRTLASVSIVLLLAAGLSACGSSSQSADAPAPKQSSSHSSSETAKESESVDEQALVDVAVDTEKTMRSWGSDSTIPVDRLTQRTAAEVIALLDPGHVPSKPDILSHLEGEEDAGPDMPWPECDSSPLCDGWAWRDWMNNDAYAYGARWVDGPTARVLDSRKGLVQVTGTVRAILLQDRDSFSQASYPDKQWHALTPAWKDYEIEDTLTIKDGHAAKYVNGKTDPWWINPWLRAWDTNMAGDTSNGTRVAIPVEGYAPETDGIRRISHITVEDPQTVPRVMGGDADGTPVDWSLWDGLIKLKPTTCQNPGACQD